MKLNWDPSERDTSWHDAFVASLSETGVLAASARAAGVARRTVYNHLRADRDFRRRVKKAMREAVDTLEGEAWRRARNGVERKKMLGDQIVTERVYSDTLLMFLLRALKPRRYRDQTTVNHTGNASLAHLMVVAKSMRDPDEGEDDPVREPA